MAQRLSVLLLLFAPGPAGGLQAVHGGTKLERGAVRFRTTQWVSASSDSQLAALRLLAWVVLVPRSRALLRLGEASSGLRSLHRHTRLAGVALTVTALWAHRLRALTATAFGPAWLVRRDAALPMVRLSHSG